ncbi:MAG: AmmeMemoRadiSam system protein A [Candidatus Thermoplasmatota archaeon]
MFTQEDGEKAVKMARKAVESAVKKEPMPEMDIPEKFEKEMGAFVTINRYPSEDLRGCIGYPEPRFKLKKAIRDGAKNAAMQDPRFPPLTEDELDSIVIEVSLLTPPEELDFDSPEELPKKITCGKHGLIASKGGRRGLLLPQVPVDQGWDEEQFLDHTCRKAGLRPSDWRKGNCSFEIFEGVIFAEEEPRGEIVQRDIGKDDN